MCPQRGNEQWRRLQDEYPRDWQSAIEIEALIRAKDPNTYLHSDRVPLPEVDLQGDQEELFGDCEGGHCFV